MLPDHEPEEGEDIPVLITFPTYFLATRSFRHRFTGEFRCEGLVKFTGYEDPNVVGVVVFTDWDAASQYRDDQFPGHKVIKLQAPDDLLAFLKYAQREVGWVAMDPYLPDRPVQLYRMDLVLSWFPDQPLFE